MVLSCKNKKRQYNLKFQRRKEMKREQEFEGQSLDSNQSVQFQYLSNFYLHKATKIYEQLLESHQLGKKFIEELGSLKDTPLVSSMVHYCKDMNLGLKSWESILDLMEARLNKMIKNNKLKKNWSTEDLHILVWLLSKYLEKHNIQSHELMNKQDWNHISAMIPGSSPRNCMFKFVSLKKFKLAQHKWQKEEEQLLLKIIEQIGALHWKLISQKLYDQNPKKRIFRTPKQCREHWSCYLDPKIKKGPWERQEDKKLLRIVLDSNCQKKWSAIKLEFQGRTQNALKNRYNLLLEKQKKINPNDSEASLINEILKEEREQETQSKIEKVSGKKESASTIPLIPEERRNLTIPFHPGVIFFFSGGPLQL